ncbi:hypothetical protein CBA19CS22_17910 [Caballeronia novacaledonica]|uniref:Uncharacterized protein n=1 Tax=Caballeronia novacaledonica TaxID=1544861 RepID=A0ACB5QU29_9BURK|nr:hypothetical protein CBA19CS22_17910 [Caballeronia novacaledonica]
MSAIRPALKAMLQHLFRNQLRGSSWPLATPLATSMLFHERHERSEGWWHTRVGRANPHGLAASDIDPVRAAIWNRLAPFERQSGRGIRRGFSVRRGYEPREFGTLVGRELLFVELDRPREPGKAGEAAVD